MTVPCLLVDTRHFIAVFDARITRRPLKNLKKYEIESLSDLIICTVIIDNDVKLDALFPSIIAIPRFFAPKMVWNIFAVRLEISRHDYQSSCFLYGLLLDLTHKRKSANKHGIRFYWGEFCEMKIGKSVLPARARLCARCRRDMDGVRS